MVGLPDRILSLLLHCHFYFSYLFEAIILSECNSLGGFICIRDSFYGYVAYDKEKSRKLVLVDRDKYCLNPFVFCQALYAYQCLLSGVACICILGTFRMATQSTA